MKVTPRLSAFVLLSGIVAGFVGAVTAGHQATAYSKPSNFKRLHARISPQGAFYPPFSMMENLALAHWSPGKTVVIVGGNSILHGVGQAADELWSLHLQQLLGDRYVVVNLSFAGAYPSEGGALVAESLLRQHIPVIYIANSMPGPVARPYESIYAYLYWDALAKDRLLPNPPRDAEVAYREQALLPAAKEKLFAAELAGKLDAPLRFQALWHHVAYRHFSTVWTYIARDELWKSKDQSPDFEPTSPPLAERFRDRLESEMEITRGFSLSFAESDGVGGWRAAPLPLGQTERDIEEIFVPRLRSRMLLLLSQNCPVYRDRLTPAEHARDELVYATYEKLWRAHGIACVTAGTGFEPADYRDRTHLSPTGGRKLAALVAAEVRRFPTP